MTDVELRDIVEHRSNCVPIEMLDSLRLCATDPISKCTFPFSLHLLMHLGLVARDCDHILSYSNDWCSTIIREFQCFECCLDSVQRTFIGS